VGIAKRRWWLLTLPPVIGFFVALLYSASLKNTYQSEMLIQIVPQRVPDAYVRSTVTIRTEDRMDSLEAMVKSRGQLEQLIAEFDLWPEERAHLPLEDVVDHMRMAIGVSLVRPGRNMPPDSFYVRFMYGDPEIASIRMRATAGRLRTRPTSSSRPSSPRPRRGWKRTSARWSSSDSGMRDGCRRSPSSTCRPSAGIRHSCRVCSSLSRAIATAS
jgi:hypothetical protein